jgi:hypothetical protein
MLNKFPGCPPAQESQGLGSYFRNFLRSRFYGNWLKMPPLLPNNTFILYCCILDDLIPKVNLKLDWVGGVGLFPVMGQCVECLRLHCCWG